MHRDVIMEVRSLLQRHWEISLHHIQRDANYVADKLAKLGAHMNEEYIVPPTSVLDVFIA